MQELDTLHPAPRRTPTAVLWIMALVVISGGALLLGIPTESPVTRAAGSTGQPTQLAESRLPPVPPSYGAASSPTHSLSEMQVP